MKPQGHTLVIRWIASEGEISDQPGVARGATRGEASWRRLTSFIHSRSRLR